MKLGRCLLLAALAASPLAAAASANPPDRVARLSYVEGEIAFEEAGQPARSTLPDRPLRPDDGLATKANARAEIALGTAALRLDEHTTIEFEALDADRVRVRLAEGIVVVTLRDLADGEAFEVATPNTTLTLVMPGEYRVEVPTESVSTITVHGGAAEAETAGGPVHIADGQRVRFESREALAMLETARPADAFDEWVLGREVQLAEAEPPEDAEEPQLDRYGEWQDDPTYGRVWMPAYAYGGYDPFQHGSWQRVGFGWSWVDPYPWSRYTFRGGRWAYLHNRWCWTPPRHQPPQHQPPHPVALETHPFGPLPARNDKDKGKIMPVERVAPRVATRETPRVAPSHPRSGAIVSSAPRNANPPRQVAAPRQSQSGGTTLQPAGSSNSASSSSSTQSSSSTSSRRSSSSSTMATRPARESGALREP